MMKRLSIILLTICSIFCTAQAQKIGYFSYKEVLAALPAYTEAMAAVDSLRNQYAGELKAAETEFNEKYELFIEQQTTLAESIKQKRQADLQSLLERNEQFKKESQRLLEQAEKEAIAPVKTKVKAAITKTAKQTGCLVVLNTDSEACPYIDENLSEDVTKQIISNY